MAGPRHRARVLWVEGKDDSAVTQSLCAAHDIPEVFSVYAKDGVTEVISSFYTELRAPGMVRFGLVVDANGNADARWQSIRNTLKAEGYAEVPERLDAQGMIIPGTSHRPVFGAWIMPDNGSSGALEDFAAQLVPPDDVLFARAGEVVDSIPAAHRRFAPAKQRKAHIHTWLAWQESPGSPMGQAITKGVLNANAPLAEAFVAWFRRLMVSDEP